MQCEECARITAARLTPHPRHSPLPALPTTNQHPRDASDMPPSIRMHREDKSCCAPRWCRRRRRPPPRTTAADSPQPPAPASAPASGTPARTILARIFGKRNPDSGSRVVWLTRAVHRLKSTAAGETPVRKILAEIIGGAQRRSQRDSCDSRVRDTLRLPARARPSVRVGDRPLRKRSTGEEE